MKENKNFGITKVKSHVEIKNYERILSNLRDEEFIFEIIILITIE